MDQEKRPLQVVAENSSRAVAHNSAVKSASLVSVATAANLIRVIRGAGKPEQIVHDALDVFEAFTCAAEINSNRAYPYHEVALELHGRAFPTTQTYDDHEEAINTILRGALQIIASRLVGQAVQEGAGRREMEKGIRRLRRP